MGMRYLLVIVGPTAVGKTKTALALATHYQTEIVSADSRQVYQELSVGTALPAAEELRAVPHHLIQHRSITEPYSVADYEKEALAVLNRLFRKKELVVLVGGSGLYIRTLLQGLDKFPPVDPDLRNQLNKRLKEEGLGPLQEQLRILDPAYFRTMDQKNPKRIIRALEVCLSTGQPYSGYLGKKRLSRPFSTLTIGLLAERSELYERINRRTDKMMAQGLLEEARELYPHRGLPALQTVGYQELFGYLDGQCELGEAVSEIKKNSRRYAKRQLTWLRQNPPDLWVDSNTALQELIEQIEKLKTGHSR